MDVIGFLSVSLGSSTDTCSGKRKVKRNFIVSVKTPRIEEKAILKGTTGLARIHGAAR
jgi:hypothetical protein